MNTEIEIKNQECELAALKNECKEVAQELTNLYKQKDEELCNYSAIKKESDDAKEKNANEERLLEEKRNNIEIQRTALEEEKLRHGKNIADLTSQEKEASKKLGWVNTRIFNAENALEDLNKQADEVMILLDSKVSIEEEISKLNIVKSEKEEIMNSAISVLQGILDSEEQKLSSVKYELITAQSELLKTKEETGNTKAELENFTRDLYTKKKDWNIIKDRLEIKFKEMYPELEMNI